MEMKIMWLVFLVSSVVIAVEATPSHDSRYNTQQKHNPPNVLDYFFREKCIDDLGCFSNGPPFFDIVERTLSLLPDDRDSIGTKFFLFTRKNPIHGLELVHGNYTLKNLLQAGFRPSSSTKFIIPGYISGYALEWKMPLKDELLRNENCNVFYVDWSGGDGPLYEQAVSNTRVVGAEVAYFINFLKESSGVKPESIHLIGHSLGAHISGYAGKRTPNLGRITGADPAGPYFTSVDPVVRLDRNDARFVDTIHTNAAPNRFMGFGTTESIGHIDFYPNGGHIQPGCKDTGHAILEFLFHPTLDIERESIKLLGCSHIRSIELFISSLRNPNCKLLGKQADSWDSYLESANSLVEATYIPLGMDAINFAPFIDKDKSFNFYLNTTDSEPYCIEQK